MPLRHTALVFNSAGPAGRQVEALREQLASAQAMATATIAELDAQEAVYKTAITELHAEPTGAF